MRTLELDFSHEINADQYSEIDRLYLLWKHLTYRRTDRPPDHVCHRFLPNFQVGTRFQLERFEKSLVYPFREVPTNLKNKNYDINQFCFPYIELMSDPWKNFCHHGANRRASICSKDPDVQPTRYKIFQQSFSSIDFHLAATFHLTTNFTIIQNIIQSYF